MTRDPIREAIERAQREMASDLGVTPDSLRRAILDGVGEGVGEIAGVIVATNEERRGPFDFYHADPILPDGKSRDDLIDSIMRAGSLSRADAERAYEASRQAQLVKSSKYQVALFDDSFQGDEPMIHLSIKRLDKEPIHDWRDLQRIKNALVGEECEAIEIYPAESRLVDTANQYHLWVFVDPQVRIPAGFNGRLVDVEPVGLSQQRPFDSPDALLPSKAELITALGMLSDWMRDNTGPSDGTLDILTVAKRLLDQVENARRKGEPS